MFTVGLTIGGLISQAYSSFSEAEIQTKSYKGFKTTTPDLKNEEVSEQTLKSEIIPATKERQEIPSPSDWVKESDIHVHYDKVEIDCRNCQWANFADTNSMDPVLDYGHNAIEIIPQKTSDIQEGDIISYELDKSYGSGTIIHRVQEIGNDEQGWYAILKGDNNYEPDPFKVRFNQIRRKVIAIIY